MLTRLCVTVFTGKPGSILHVPFIHNARNANLRIGGIQNISFDTIKYYRERNKTPSVVWGRWTRGWGAFHLPIACPRLRIKCAASVGIWPAGVLCAPVQPHRGGHDLHSRALFGARVAIPGQFCEESKFLEFAKSVGELFRTNRLESLSRL